MHWTDFGDSPLQGEPKAFAEFMAAHASVLEAEPFVDLVSIRGKGKAFIVRTKST